MAQAAEQDGRRVPAAKQLHQPSRAAALLRGSQELQGGEDGIKDNVMPLMKQEPEPLSYAPYKSVCAEHLPHVPTRYAHCTVQHKICNINHLKVTNAFIYFNFSPCWASPSFRYPAELSIRAANQLRRGEAKGKGGSAIISQLLSPSHHPKGLFASISRRLSSF